MMRLLSRSIFLLPLLSSMALSQNLSYLMAEDSYLGALRPQVHFSPPTHFMNDPNGAFRDANGTWHLYYQYNPTGLEAGNQHWGHATSPDLYTWTNHPIAISPRNSSEQIFSGSAVIDTNNTSGFFPNQTNGVVAIYTLNTAVSQSQEIAYSYDGGYTFTRYANNPVIDINSTQFRDPKVIWHKESQKWIMTVALAEELKVRFYTSPDLKEWKYASEIGGLGVLRNNNSLQYECPNLVRVPQGNRDSKYLLFLSINPGAPLGGSATEYFVGEFNGTHFVPENGTATSQDQFVDFAKDNYAGQFFYRTEDAFGNDEPIYIGWANNWQYTNDVPTGDLEGWRSAMSLPRTVNLSKDGKLVQKPYSTLSNLYEQALSDNNTASLCGTSGAVYFSVDFCNSTASITFSNADGESVEAGITEISGERKFYLNRSTTGFNSTDFTREFNATVPLSSTGSFYGVYDRSMIEVFLEDGESVGTMVFYANKPLDTASVTSNKASISALKSTWNGEKSLGYCDATKRK